MPKGMAGIDAFAPAKALWLGLLLAGVNPQEPPAGGRCQGHPAADRMTLARARLGRPAVLFIGWFGPRGLASVVFGLLTLEDLTEAAARPALTVIVFTVLLSIVAHSLSAGPLASRYGPRLTPPPGAAGPVRLAEIPA